MNNYNYHSLRARKARLGGKLNNSAIKLLLTVAMIALAVAGVWAILQQLAIGWLLIGLASWVMMLLIWAKGELSRLPIGKTDDINDILSANCLRLLGPNPTPKSMAATLYKTRSGGFLALRFGITPELLAAFAANMGDDITPILEQAREVRAKLNAEQISGGMLAIALMSCHPEMETALLKLRLEPQDLYEGMEWYNHLHGLVEKSREKRHDGGIARDLSFGYIPLLQRFGQNLSQQLGNMGPQVLQASHHENVEKMLQLFSGNGRQNVALIGPEGSGKMTIVQAFAAKLLDSREKLPGNLRFRQVFVLDASLLVSAARGKDDLEALVMRVLSEAFGAKNIILCLNNAQLFFEEGTGSVDISNLIMPMLEAGKLRIILTMDEQKFLEIAAKNSALSNSLNKIMVSAADETETMLVMQDQAPRIEHKSNVVINYWALKEAYRLSERYLHDIAQPGASLSLLESAVNYAGNGLVTDASVQQAIEKTEGVKVQVVGSEEDRSKLLNLESLIHERMIDQEAAVKTVSDALRRAGAKVRNEGRPIGTFLFLGPTGVGKTELAKAISRVYFNGEKNIVRLDLNEYVNAEDVKRLIEEGSKNEHSLTAQVMKQPFAVVLLDEIEKAHPQVLTTLLQVLDEGVLRDEKNREVSFRDTIIIATSNAGANEIREKIAAGADLNALKEQLLNELIAKGEFKPEFLNRFDEICLFGPLSKENLLKVVDIMVADVNKTLAPQKISVSLTDEARMVLVERGYDPMLGARPMRRIVQKTVENLVAKAVLANEVGSGAKIEITGEMVIAQLDGQG